MNGADYAGRTFSAPAERTNRWCEIVVAQLPGERPIRVLDVGCGTGALVFRLLEALPHAEMTGVDVSAANIRAAEAACAASPGAARARFVQADYLDYTAVPVDAIVSYGVLQLVGGGTRALFQKLARDLVPGGRLIACMPYDCMYNRMFVILRRVLRAFRSPALDSVILRIGRLLHGHEMDDEGLRERIHYMYLPPARVADRALRDQVAPSVGLRMVARYSMKNVSLSQLRHEIIVFERTAA
jgi:SAM-dependent methyltransferase